MGGPIFGVDIGALIRSTMRGQLHAATLHITATAIGGHGEPITSAEDYPCEGVRTAWDAKTMAARGYPMDAAKIIILQTGGLTPVKGQDRITITGETFRILDIERDAADATWTFMGIKA